MRGHQPWLAHRTAVNAQIFVPLKHLRQTVIAANILRLRWPDHTHPVLRRTGDAVQPVEKLLMLIRHNQTLRYAPYAFRLPR